MVSILWKYLCVQKTLQCQWYCRVRLWSVNDSTESIMLFKLFKVLSLYLMIFPLLGRNYADWLLWSKQSMARFEAYFVRSSFSPGNKFPVEACIKNPALAVLKVCEGNKHVLAMQKYHLNLVLKKLNHLALIWIHIRNSLSLELCLSRPDIAGTAICSGESS